MLEDVSNPFSILFACFLAANRFDVLRVSEDNSAGSFQNVVNRFSCGFHAHVLAVVLCKPHSTATQLTGVGGKPLAFVAGDALLVG